MTDVFFYIFSTAALAAGIGVVLSRNTVNGAMFLIGTFLSMAAMFVLLEAYFLAVIQVLVYAGAVMVLFLFIIMLLDVRESAAKKMSVYTWVASVIGLAILIVGTASIVSAESIKTKAAALPKPSGASLKPFGYEQVDRVSVQTPLLLQGKDSVVSVLIRPRQQWKWLQQWR